jgi:hypothetical protein
MSFAFAEKSLLWHLVESFGKVYVDDVKSSIHQCRCFLQKFLQKYNPKDVNIQIKMESLVKAEIKEETVDIGTEFLSASSCNDEDTISR